MLSICCKHAGDMEWYKDEVEDSKWYQDEEKASDPLDYHDFMEEMHSNPLQELDPKDYLRFDEADEYIRMERWRTGYEVDIDDGGRTLRPYVEMRRGGVTSGIGHIIECDSQTVTVQWTTYCGGFEGIKTFSRRDIRVRPLIYHIDNVITNGKNACFKYEYDEEKVDVNGNVICKVWFNAPN